MNIAAQTAVEALAPVRQAALLHWINTHDCGVQPCGIAQDDGSIVIQVAYVERDGSEGVEKYTVRTLAEARDALGY
jgi:hypothetical protein